MRHGSTDLFSWVRRQARRTLDDEDRRRFSRRRARGVTGGAGGVSRRHHRRARDHRAGRQRARVLSRGGRRAPRRQTRERARRGGRGRRRPGAPARHARRLGLGRVPRAPRGRAPTALADDVVADDVVGSPGFLAPEVLAPPYDAARSDVWSLGCVTLELAVGTGWFRRHWLAAYRARNVPHARADARARRRARGPARRRARDRRARAPARARARDGRRRKGARRARRAGLSDHGLAGRGRVAPGGRRRARFCAEASRDVAPEAADAEAGVSPRHVSSPAVLDARARASRRARTWAWAPSSSARSRSIPPSGWIRETCSATYGSSIPRSRRDDHTACHVDFAP